MNRLWLILVLAAGCFAAPMTDLFTDDANVVIRWEHLHFTIVATAGYPLSPPMSARANAILTTAIYDTWTHYDKVANPSMDYSTVRVKGSAEDIDTAISVAAWNTVKYIYKDLPNSETVNTVADQLLLDITGLSSPSDNDVRSPVGLGLTVSQELLAYRDNDGANSLGDKPFTNPTGTGLRAYQDYTNYSPCNKPWAVNVTKTVATCSSVDVNKWEPLTEPLATGGTGTKRYASPHMALVTPFALDYPSQYRPAGPPVKNLDPENRKSYEEQHNEVLRYSATLDDEKKVIADFWAPGSQFGNPPNMFALFAMNALITQERSIEDSAKLLFALANSVFDAGIAAWDAKRCYDSARPITALRCLYCEQQITAWGGPYQGVKTIDGGLWIPYQSPFQATPPFSEYVSGHSTFSAAAAHILKSFFKSSSWIGPNSVDINAGESMLEPKITDTSNPRYRAGFTDVANNGFNTVGYSPAATVTLTWNTWQEAADQAGISRLYGGIHIEDGNNDGATLGENVGKAVWNKVSTLFAGDSDPEPSCGSEALTSSAGALYVPLALAVVTAAALF